MKKIMCSKLFTILLLCASIAPTFLGLRFALPAADDFSNAVMYFSFVDQSNTLLAPFYAVCWAYMNWQGTYFSVFFDELFRPYDRWGLIGFRVYLFVIIVLLAIAVLYFAYVLCMKEWKVEKRTTIFIVQFSLLYFFFNSFTAGEIFYWYTGVSTYTFPLVICLFGSSMYMQYCNGEKVAKFFYTAIILGFLTSGTTLQVAAVVCTIYLLIWISMYEREQSFVLWIRRGIPFFVTAFGALINVVAPGNYARHNLVSESYSIGQVAVWTLVESTRQIIGTLRDSVLPFFLVVLFLIALLNVWRNNLKLPRLIVRSIFVMAIIPINIFPVCLGYHQPNLGAERNYYICRVCICVALAYLSILWGQYIGSYLKIQMRKEELLLFGMICVLLVTQTGMFRKYYDGTSGRVWIQLRTGELQECEQKWRLVLEELENSTGGDVVIEDMNIPETILKTPGLTNEADHWINVCVSEYYGVNSIVIE